MESKKELTRAKKLFSERLGALIENQSIQQNILAEKIGVSESTVGKWLLQKALPRMGAIQKLSDFFNVPKSYFLEEHYDSANTRHYFPKDMIPIYPAMLYKDIPFVPGNVSAGRLMEIESITELPICPVPTLLLDPQYRNSDNLMLLEINGDSMDRVIPDGSRVLIKYNIPRENFHDGDIVVVGCDGEYTCKRYHDDKANRRIILTPDSTNPDFMPIIINYDENPYIIGKVVMYIAKV